MSEWKECKLGDFISFGNGKSRPQNDGIIPIYGGNGILGYCNQYNYQDETIIIGRVGAYCGSVFYENKPIWVSDNALSAKPKERNNTKFLFYFLKNLELNQFAEGSSHPLVTQTLLNSIDVEIPGKVTEQQAIASVLSSLDDKIDLLHRQNKTLEAMAETLFRQWFVEEAGEGWEEGKIPDEFDYVMGVSPLGKSYNENGEGVPMYQGNADFEFRFPKRRIFTTDPKRFAEKFDTLISVRAPVGAQNMADERCCIGRGVAAFKYKLSNEYYTYTYFKIKSLMKEIDQFNHTGTVFGSISKSDFEEISIILPPSQFVDNYQKEVRPIDDKIIANCHQIRTLEKLRDTLLPKLMSGEVRLKL
ncbi:MAG: restriction endonuclease subunit S [Desulfobacterales bacterium]|nr:restriction endonuclease subunit S [Desulfobacterales bacterium]